MTKTFEPKTAARTGHARTRTRRASPGALAGPAPRNTTWAIWNLAGPDAAIEYLRGTKGSGVTEQPVTGSTEETTARPTLGFVRTLCELVENIATAPQAQFEVNPPDKDGDVLLRA